ncbi:MAG: hypothetical protein A2Y79_01525 [Deltaproteobacteria bacterium RBG_13_43_22]|nr:MAG: hypothetical protein A2Y79_01525 [Deltaproteobacteria bacterium RBG_13_43_22]
MIDIHCHILPGLDDGARDMEEALEMCRVAQADGIQTIVATPHCRNEIYRNHEKTIWPVFEQMQEAVSRAEIPINLLPGADLHIHPEIISFLKQNPRLLLGGRYFLLELPAHSIPIYIRDFIFQALLAGFVPIITHPERNTVILRHWKIIQDWVKAGALVQVTAMSLTGAFGSRIKESAFHLVRMGLVHLIASDAHSSKRRPPILSRAREILEGLLGPSQAQAMVKTIPEKILRGEPVDTTNPTGVPPPKQSFLKRLFLRHFNN